MKTKFLKAKYWLLMALMGLLGVATSCEKESEPIDMYGCPPTEYNDSLPNG